MSTPTLRAVYSSPESSRTFEHPLSAPLPSSPGQVNEKVSYLSNLRKLVPILQDDVNIFLTAKMEEDKKAAEEQGRQMSEKEAKEEENYGEENVEDEA